MNLGKLLGAGKSFISGGKPAAYRTDKRFYLPQFVSPKNPFATMATGATQVELPKPAAKKPAELTGKNTTLPWMKTRKMPVVAAQAGPTRAATWVSKLNPVSLFRTAPDVVDEGMATVQAELSLEKVKVVHNDLTDADVEIVPMKSRPAPEPALADLQPSKRSWEVLGERIMKATAL
ncbi:MAG: hypothetical protein PHY43_12875 [Verrucomicrobiales bacterium]|nr:hypothetical protein [Verrucomicrobiales bacterium]